MRFRLVVVHAFVVFITVVIVACGASLAEPGSAFPSDAGTLHALDAASSPSLFGLGGDACTGLECAIATDCDGAKTTLRGTVYDPAGANPLYNVQVYIPGGEHPSELPPLKDSTKSGVECDTCAGRILAPLRAALTNSAGEFTLDDVPVASNLPLVVQVGKWRRLFTVNSSARCAENRVPDRMLRLPSRTSEGDMPQIAVTTGGWDTLECFLRGIGVDDTEFVEGHGANGHVHLFRGTGGGLGSQAQPFWTDAQQLKRYDLLLLSCEGDEENQNKGKLDAVANYVNSGGKAFATHFHYTWFKNAPEPGFNHLATWGTGAAGADGAFAVNRSFPKGVAFANWLVTTDASSTLGTIALKDVKDSVKAIHPPALGWIADPDDADHAKYFSVNTPIGAPVEQQCGRAVFSDVHIGGLGGAKSIGECSIKHGTLSGQQKALEFLFFDLSSCIADESKQPEPPK